MKVKKSNLLLIAGVVWTLAGFNILKIGVQAYAGYGSTINFLLSAIVFLIFWMMIFSKLVTKHTARILRYEEEMQYFFKFFDRKSFLIMAVMMSGGIALRVFRLWPLSWIAVFYSGLGAALLLAGFYFTYHFFTKRTI